MPPGPTTEDPGSAHSERAVAWLTTLQMEWLSDESFRRGQSVSRLLREMVTFAMRQSGPARTMGTAP
jgi:hypothetical protein